MTDPFVQWEAIKVKGSKHQAAEEQVVVEKALTVYLNDAEFVTMICSPGQEEDLVIGFLCSEGVVKGPEEYTISMDLGQGLVWVETPNKNVLGQKLFLKRYLTSCCGKGRSSFYFANDARLAGKISASWQLTGSQVCSYSDQLEGCSELFRLTGGVHGGALAADGKLQFYSFDIGRHNVLDKLYGMALRAGQNLQEKALVFSGRVSSEILIKTAKMGCPILIGRSAPTDLALNLAEELGITVVGFARGDRMNIYTHPQRILL